MSERLKWVFAAISIGVLIAGAWVATMLWLSEPLPGPDDVARIMADGNFGPKRKRVKFEVPVEHWPRIRAALGEPKRDFEPAKWEVIGTLDITARGGRVYRVDLYHTYERVGAFAAGPTFESRVYYRGGNSEELTKEMAAAYLLATKEGESK